MHKLDGFGLKPSSARKTLFNYAKEPLTQFGRFGQWAQLAAREHYRNDDAATMGIDSDTELRRGLVWIGRHFRQTYSR